MSGQRPASQPQSRSAAGDRSPWLIAIVVSIATFMVVLDTAILYGSNQITPQLMQTNFPYTAMLSGLAMMPGGIAMIVMMPNVGQISGHVQPKYMTALGFTIIALAMWY